MLCVGGSARGGGGGEGDLPFGLLHFGCPNHEPNSPEGQWPEHCGPSGAGEMGKYIQSLIFLHQVVRLLWENLQNCGSPSPPGPIGRE